MEAPLRSLTMSKTKQPKSIPEVDTPLSSPRIETETVSSLAELLSVLSANAGRFQCGDRHFEVNQSLLAELQPL